MLTHEKLKELLHYDPATGLFTWLVRSAHRLQIGDVAGNNNSHGRRQISVLGTNYRAHRLAWLWMTGSWPQYEIDHRNGNPDDNRWDNLRDGSHTFNMQNRRTPNINNKTGFLGVSPNHKRFLACIKVNGKKLNLGTYTTPELAHAAYVKAKRKLHEGCTL